MLGLVRVGGLVFPVFHASELPRLPASESWYRPTSWNMEHGNRTVLLMLPVPAS